MFNLPHYFQKFVKNRKPKVSYQISGSGLSDNALAQVNKGLQEMKRLHWDFKMKLQTIENQLQIIQRSSSDAWSEREHLFSNYYDTIRSILGVFDDCENAMTTSPQVSVVYEGLRKILEKQGIESIQVKESDSFNAEFHQCEETVQKEEYSDGGIVQIIEAGYMKKFANGKLMVIRPVKVIVNKNRIGDS